MAVYLNQVIPFATNGIDAEPIKRAYSEAPQASDPDGTTNSLGSLKGLTIGTVSCLLAHWYFLPGLTFQRQRIRLGAAGVFSRKATPRAALSRFLNDPPSPTSYLDFHFAWQALMSRESLGNYLDISSPSLFPLVLLARQRAKKATLLSTENDIEALIAGAGLQVPNGITCNGVRPMPALSENYDVITSLSWIGHIENEVELIAQWWDVLKPGGTLLLSAPCAKTACEEYISEGASRKTRRPNKEVFVRRLYDLALLKSRIFDKLGQPKRFAVYGEATPGSYKAHLLRKASEGSGSDWRDSMIVGRDWRCYASIQDLPGEGIIAMKFVRPGIAGATSDRRLA
jgi:SAM-dependent methyltransferase